MGARVRRFELTAGQRMVGVRPGSHYTMVMVREMHSGNLLGSLLFEHHVSPGGESSNAGLRASSWTELGQQRRRENESWEREARLAALDYLLRIMGDGVR